MNPYDVYKEQHKIRIGAEKWLELKDSVDSQSHNYYPLSLTHSTFMLMRCGQSSPGANNYHESPKEFNAAMLQVIENNYAILTKQALDILKEEEASALLVCSVFVDEIQQDIEEVRKERNNVC